MILDQKLFLKHVHLVAYEDIVRKEENVGNHTRNYAPPVNEVGVYCFDHVCLSVCPLASRLNPFPVKTLFFPYQCGSTGA